MKTVTLIAGDLVGRDLAPHVIHLTKKAGAAIDWECVDLGGSRVPGEGIITEECLASVRKNKLALRGPVGSGGDMGHESPSVYLRKQLGLFAGIRHVKNLAGVPARYQGIDLVIIRENMEDVYAGAEHEVVPGVVESIKVVTRAATERIFDLAYQYARAEGRKRLAIVHKANIMKLCDGLFLKVGEEVAQRYPDIETRALIVDNTAMQLVQRPEQFDVLVCGALYGDLLSDLAAGLVGGISAVWGKDRNEDTVVFEAIHGHAPELMGLDVANPLPMLVPAIKLLEHVGEAEPARRLQSAVERVLAERKWLTADLGGTARTSDMVRAIEGAL